MAGEVRGMRRRKRKSECAAPHPAYGHLLPRAEKAWGFFDILNLGNVMYDPPSQAMEGGCVSSTGAAQGRGGAGPQVLTLRQPTRITSNNHLKKGGDDARKPGVKLSQTKSN